MTRSLEEEDTGGTVAAKAEVKGREQRAIAPDEDRHSR